MANNGKQYFEPTYYETTSQEYAKGYKLDSNCVPFNGVMGTLCLFEYKNGTLTRLTNAEEDTKLPLNVFVKVEKNFSLIDNIYFTFGKLVTKRYVRFNQYLDYNQMAGIDDVFKISNNKMVLVYHKYCYWYNGNFGYNDWAFIRLCALGVYKLK